MANVDIRVGKKDAVFFSANPTLILKDGQFLFNSDTLELFIGDGTSQLSALVAINVPPSSGVQSVTGPQVDNTDPVNPIIIAQTKVDALFSEAKSTDIASASTTDLSTATGNLIHITGTTTITSFGTAQAGTKVNLVFDDALILTNSANIILPNSLNIQTAANDIAELVSEGSGIWRLMRYQRYNDSWTTYSPTLTGFSVKPTGFTARYILNGKTCMISFNSTGIGTSNSTALTMTLPFVAASIDMSAFPYALDNGAVCTAGGLTTAGSNVINILKNGSSGWTPSGSKRVFGIIIYQIQ